MALEPISRAAVSTDYGNDDAKTSNVKVPVTVFKDEDQTNNPNNGQSNKSSTLEKEVTEAISKVNEFLKQKRTRCEFAYIEKLNRVSITVYDKETEKVIKEIPPEESLKTIEKIWEIAGLIVDEKR